MKTKTTSFNRYHQLIQQLDRSMKEIDLLLVDAYEIPCKTNEKLIMRKKKQAATIGLKIALGQIINPNN